MEQTKLDSMFEVTMGGVATSIVGVVFNLTMLPLVLLTTVTLTQGLALTASFACMSIGVRYIIRRIFNARLRHKMHQSILRGSSGSIQSLPGRVRMPDMRITDRNAHAHTPRGHDRGRAGPVQPEAGVSPNKELRK